MHFRVLLWGRPRVPTSFNWVHISRLGWNLVILKDDFSPIVDPDGLF